MDAKRSKKEPLRQRAEKLLSKKFKPMPKIQDNDIKALVHELQVHQVELEMQNEELRKAQVEIEESRKKYVELYEFAPVGYFTLNNMGVIVEANLRGASLLGVEGAASQHSFYPFCNTRRLESVLGLSEEGLAYSPQEILGAEVEEEGKRSPVGRFGECGRGSP